MKIGLILVFLGATLVGFGHSGDAETKAGIFVEELRFGGDRDDDHYLWPTSTVTLAVDAKGHIFVADTGSSRVLHFDADGSFVDVAVNKGQGPGEVEQLTSFQILDDGTAVAYEHRGRGSALHFFDKSLKFTEKRNAAEIGLSPLQLKLSGNGKWAFAEFNDYDREKNHIVTKIGLLDDRLKLTKVFSEVHIPAPDPGRMQDGKYWSEFFSGIARLYFDKKGVIAFDNQGRIYTAISDTYAITRWRPDMSAEEQVFKRADYRKAPFLEEDISQLAQTISAQYTEGYPPQFRPYLTPEIVHLGLEMAGIPKWHQPIRGLIPSEEGHLLVVLDEPDEERAQNADLFSPAGAYLGRLRNAHMGFLGPDDQVRMLFKSGFAYTIETDAEGNNSVVRYRLKHELH